MKIEATARSRRPDTEDHSPSLLRCAIVWALASVLLLGVAAACAFAASGPLSTLVDELDSSSAHAGPDAQGEAMLLLAGAAGALAAARLWCIVTATCFEVAVSGASAGARRPSGTTRRLALLACGVAVGVGSVVAPAQAADRSTLDGLSSPERPSSSAAAETSSPEFTPQGTSRDRADERVTPTRPAAVEPSEGTPSPTPTAPAPSPKARPHTEPPGSGRVTTVRRGDSLWAIARAHASSPDEPRALHSGARNNREIAELTRALHAANRDVIGNDPDLILPGQRLSLPDTSAPADHTDPASHRDEESR